MLCRSRAASGCNVFYWCPDPAGCSINLADSSADGGWLAYRHCALRQQPSALPDSAQPIKASRKGKGSVSVTSGKRLFVFVTVIKLMVLLCMGKRRPILLFGRGEASQPAIWPAA